MRFRFRYSIRALLVLTTLVAVGIKVYLYEIGGRVGYRQQLLSDPRVLWLDESDYMQRYPGGDKRLASNVLNLLSPVPARKPDVPWLQRQLGDKALALIVIPPDASQEQFETAFPEAVIRRQLFCTENPATGLMHSADGRDRTPNDEPGLQYPPGQVFLPIGRR